jgi:GT2 family glycosyltransferase/SAM-dependent methyltransferase
VTLAVAGKYTQFDDAPESTHKLVLSLVPAGSRVLEFGCATGYMSEVLRLRIGCEVTGIEVDENAAALARQRADRVFVGDAETLDYSALLGADQFDVVLFADVLEHLRDPSAVLRRIRPFVASNGVIVASIPNIAHGSVRVALLGGDFRYTSKGLLDDSHLRFFTRDSIIALFEDAGYVIVDWLHKHIPIDQTEVESSDPALAQSLKGPLEADPDATIYQFVVRAKRAEDLDGAHSTSAEIGALRAGIDAREVAIRALEARVAQHTQAAAESAQLLAARESTILELRESLDDRQKVRRELASLRKLLRQQSADIAGLQSSVAEGAIRQVRLERFLETVHQDLLQREDDLHASLYELQSSMRPDRAGYQQVIRRIQELVRSEVPRSATVLVASRGDPALLSLYGRTGWHFPRLEDGGWAGEYPATSLAAIAQIESLRAEGAEFLLFPKPAMWWLQHYAGLARHLDHRYRLVRCDDETCALYDLRQPATGAPDLSNVFEDVVAACRGRLGRDPAILDWMTARPLADGFPLLTIFSPPSSEGKSLPYFDASVDVVALSTDDPVMQAEARRVASLAVLTFSRGDDLRVTWMGGNLEALRVPPSVSIVIPCFNKLSITQACLRALEETLPRELNVEIVVVDDASTDDTPLVLRQWAEAGEQRLVVRNSTNVGFIASCNRGARASTRELLVFLNNDTIPLPGWLDRLVQIFADRPDAGAVGGRLLYPDGRLQEAGAVVFADGSGANVGRGEYDAERPLFTFVREVDYCSGALLATPRALFTAIGGFDRRYAPAYYEDTDYCFAVRARGKRVYYQPRSVVVHREGASSGTDASSGVKRFQVVNRSRFAAKWATALSSHLLPAAHYDMDVWHHLTLVTRTRNGG